MRKLFLSILTILLCSWTIALASEECPIGYSMYGQTPLPDWDIHHGFYWSDINSPARHFDNFSGVSDEICRLTWWGLDLIFPQGVRECIEDPMDFEIAFYPDDGTGKPDTLHPIYTLAPVTPARTPTGMLYGPYTYNDTTFYLEINRYDLVLDPCISVAQGWLTIIGISYGGDPEDCLFNWVKSLDGDGMSYSLRSTGWLQRNGDAAFCLGGEYSPTYGACCDLSTGNCDYIEYQDCPEGARFEAGAPCEDLDPPCRETIFCEPFDTSLGTFTDYQAGDPAGWHWTLEQGNNPGSAYHANDNVVSGCDDWLISPGDYTVFEGDKLTWDQRDHDSEYITYHGVLVSSNYVDGSDPTTADWTEIYSGVAPENAWGTEVVDISAFAGEVVHIAFRYQGDYSDYWWVDNVCVFGVGPACDYVPGDCDHNDVSLELSDVVAMIGMYRGTQEPYYTCDCPPHGSDFAPEADPNGNCVAFELGDVVTEIGAYRGTAEPAGCPDCSGSLRLNRGSSGETTVMPRLKSKVKTGDRGVSE